MRFLNCRLTVFAVSSLFMAGVSQAERFTYHHEQVLGTSLELEFECPNRSVADYAENVALLEIDRLDLILSSHRSDSEFAGWASADSTIVIGNDLRNVLERAEHWRVQTGGTFDTRAEAVELLYRQAAMPNAAARNVVLEQLQNQPFSHPGELTRADRLPMSLNALAKGYVLDCVCQRVLDECKQVSGCMVNIGGDVKIAGKLECTAGITDPQDPSENAKPIAKVVLRAGQGLATSGNYRRYVRNGDLAVNHIFDPRTALPGVGIASATVIAQSAMDADALATALCVLPVAEGLQLSEQQHVDCLLIDHRGQHFTSTHWPGTPVRTAVPNLVSTTSEPEKQKPDSSGSLIVEFTLAANNQAGRYRRPYVAVWLEDQEGFPVRTSILWVQTTQPGPRWHRDLTRWFRNDRMRKLTEDIDLLDTLSGATRGPGEYTARFDGFDNSGQPLEAGQYVLCMEVAREHGTYQIIREKFIWGETKLAKELQPNAEISAASYSFTPANAKVN